VSPCPFLVDDAAPTEIYTLSLHDALPISSRKHKNQIVRRNIYVISNNPETKFADWAAYRFSRDTIGKSKRTRWKADPEIPPEARSEEHTSELQSRENLVCRLLLEKKKNTK